jgi:probable F420-dependent oxidoreductase
MRFSCSLPNHADEFLTIAAITRMVQAMDKAGIDATFVTDHPAPSSRWVESGGHATLDPFVALAVAASASPRIRLHTHILVLAYRNPFIVAKSAASLDALSGGRFIMGIGTGYLKPEYAAVGVPFDERGAITDEAITVMRKAWTGQAVEFKGSHFEARDAMVLPTPRQKNGVPIWAGGNADRAIRRAVEMCEGWCPFPVEGIVTKTARTICMGRWSQHSDMKPNSLGDAAQAIDDYAALQDVGVTWSTTSVPSPSVQAFVENVQWFGEEVVAKLSPRGTAG